MFAFFPLGAVVAIAQSIEQQRIEQQLLELQREETERMTREFDELARRCDPNTIDLPPDAVREVRELPRLVAPERWTFGRIEWDSDGGECD